ncbi:THO complex subunit 1 transcription elongation factor-domain-containing protein [Umbelopsis sp. PMI_123]|nr:THO complex subunit 1 transcription elongation factor-domain-containing protein [Umbelopsis sp. PMI_123]
MPEFDAFREKAQAALRHCLTETEAYRVKTGAQDIPHLVLLALIEQHIIPLTGPDNGANVQLSPEPKYDWRKNALELIYRQELYDIVISNSEPNDQLFQQLYDCLDIVLISTDKELVEPVTVLTLIEELLEQQTIPGCEKIFDYIESRKTKLTVGMMPGKGKGLVLLRMCNEMLRRLSKNMSTVFCGRILMFLANSFSLGERSGVNLRGEFNVENVVKYDSEEELKNDTKMTEEQKAFYTLFWSTQGFLTNPPSIFADGNYEKFKDGVETTISKFNDMSQREAVVAGSTADHHGKENNIRKRSVSEMDVDESFSDEAIRDVYNDYFFPKFLTSRELLELELEDVSFRRTVLVQFLIALQYLEGHSNNEIEKTQAVLASKNAKSLATQTLPKLTEEQELWISEVRTKVLNELQASNPNGNEYTRIVKLVLEHEKNWIIWKAASCPPFEMPPVDPNEFTELVNSKRRKLTATLPPYRYAWGNAEISNLYHRTLGRDLTEMMSAMPDLPSAKDYLDDVLPRLQNSTASVDARYELANAILFQVMRLLFLKEAHLVSKVFLAKKELMKIARDKAAIAAKTGEADGEGSEDNKASDSNGITEKSVEIEIKVLQQARKIINDDEEARRAAESKIATNGSASPQVPTVTVQSSPSLPAEEAKGSEAEHKETTETTTQVQEQPQQPSSTVETKEPANDISAASAEPMETDQKAQNENTSSATSPKDSAMQEATQPDTVPTTQDEKVLDDTTNHNVNEDQPPQVE